LRDVLNALATRDNNLARCKTEQYDGTGERAEYEAGEHMTLIGHLPGMLGIEAVEIKYLTRLHGNINMRYDVLYVIADDAESLPQMMSTQDVADAVGREQPLIPAARTRHHKLSRREQEACTNGVGQADCDCGKFGSVI